VNRQLLKLVAIVGPTCTGKSELSLTVARMFKGEIINGDSMQVYRHFNIGTAKPDVNVREEIPHYLIDIIDPTDRFNAALFKKMADDAIYEVHSRGALPILVGGTGLYFRTLIYGLFRAEGDEKMRRELEKVYSNNPQGLFEELKMLDPEYAAKISPRDKIRVVRAMEVFRTTGVKMSQWWKIHGFKEKCYDTLIVGLTADRG